MGLLDGDQLPQQNAPPQQPPQQQYANPMDFINSDQGLALAQGLLSQPTFSLGLGAGIKNMQEQKTRGLENQYRQLQIQDTQRQMQGINELSNIINKKLKDDPTNETAQAAHALALAGNIPQAMAMMTAGQADFGQPQSVLDAQGHPKLIQTDKYGRTREVPGYIPRPTNQTQLSVNPATGELVFTQGGAAGAVPSSAPPGFTKNPMMGPSRGGQGGTYENKATGQIISSDTNKQTSQDQATIAAIQRLEPVVDKIVNNLPQFQTAARRGQEHVEGFMNNYFGANFQLPSSLAAGMSNLNLSPEPLMKIMGVPSTDTGLAGVRGIIEPRPGESGHYYKQRVLDELATFRKVYMAGAKDRLANGIIVQDGNSAPNQQGTAYQGQQANEAPAQQPQTQQDNNPQAASLEAQAQDAIARGADAKQVQARLQQLRGY